MSTQLSRPLPAERARPPRSRGGELERFPCLNLEIEPRRAKNSTHANVNHESESNGTGPCSEARRIAGREGATCAATGRRAREFSMPNSENRTSPREESLTMQRVNHESESDGTGPCSETRHIAGRAGATCAVKGATCAARAFLISKSESRTSPREESLSNYETARGSRSEEWHIAGRESATRARRLLSAP